MADEGANPFRRRRRNLGDIFDEEFFNRDFGFDFEDVMERMARMIDDLSRHSDVAGKKYVYGFQMHSGPDGKPVVEEFGNVPKEGAQLPASDEREPLVDVIDGEEEVTVIAELPGVSKEDIDLKTDDKTLTIKVDNEKRRYFKEVSLPAKIKSDSVKATYKNGILEVKLKRAEIQKDEKKKIKVE